MNVTDYIFEKAKSLIERLPEVRDEGLGYEMANDGSTECEVGEFLYGMVRILKPKFILETGTYKGLSSTYMGQALKDNKRGNLYTLEIEDRHIQTSKELWNAVGVNEQIASVHQKSFDFIPQDNYDLMFLDSEPNLRFGELIRFYPNLNPGGYVFIHDTPRTLCQGNINPDHPELPSWPFGDLPEQVKSWLRNGDLVKIHFPNPRGMIGFYKPHPEDYHV